MSDRVVVMDKAVIQQIGNPYDIYAKPANAFVANFIGVANLLEGTMRGRDGEACKVEIPLGQGREPLHIGAIGGEGATDGQRLVVCIRPEDLKLHLTKPELEGGMNLIEGEVIDTIYLGNFLECHVQVGPYDVNVQIDHFEQLEPGQKVYLTFYPDHGLSLTS